MCVGGSKELSKDLRKYFETNVTAIRAPLDDIAQFLLPDDSPLVLIATSGNGSCLYNDISIGLVGKFQNIRNEYAMDFKLFHIYKTHNLKFSNTDTLMFVSCLTYTHTHIHACTHARAHAHTRTHIHMNA